jgi:hypothetical protein
MVENKEINKKDNEEINKKDNKEHLMNIYNDGDKYVVTTIPNEFYINAGPNNVTLFDKKHQITHEDIIPIKDIQTIAQIINDRFYKYKTINLYVDTAMDLFKNSDKILNDTEKKHTPKDLKIEILDLLTTVLNRIESPQFKVLIEKIMEQVRVFFDKYKT